MGKKASVKEKSETEINGIKGISSGSRNKWANSIFKKVPFLWSVTIS
jgi:hypothetical protein